MKVNKNFTKIELIITNVFGYSESNQNPMQSVSNNKIFSLDVFLDKILICLV